MWEESEKWWRWVSTFSLDVAQEEVGEEDRAVLFHAETIVFDDLAREYDFFYQNCQISISRREWYCKKKILKDQKIISLALYLVSMCKFE